MKSSTARAAAIVPLDYHAVRVLRFRSGLIDFLRRWSVYVAIAALVFSAGSNAPLAIAAALAANLVRPLLIAADHGWWIVPATAVYTVAGVLPVVLTRPLWWPRGWAAAERVLPIEAAAIRRSDRFFSWTIAAPWQALLLLGVASLGLNGAASHDPWRGWVAVAACVVAAIASQRLALQWMRRVRRDDGLRRSPPRFGMRHRHASGAVAVAAMGQLHALVLLPLIRGRATRSASALAVGTITTCVCATARLWSDVATGWSLAALALGALAATSAIRPCTIHDLQPGWRAHRELPLTPRLCELARIAVVLLPATVGVAVALAVIGWARGDPRFRVLAGYGLVLAVGCAFEATTHETMPPPNHAARWILILAVAIAFGSEVSPT